MRQLSQTLLQIVSFSMLTFGQFSILIRSQRFAKFSKTYLTKLTFHEVLKVFSFTDIIKY